ncbi:M48 family metallopeptidase [Edaphosphingomonas haloaromaticamans]|nr:MULTISPECIES: SprT family zinc-dependent metalloprotease [Sphingomonas]MDX3885777.1 SprT family zinc-dependent metalloprotease [Sphingomonas sp.]
MSIDSSDPVFTGGGRTRRLEVRRMAQARALRLAIDPRDGAVRLTLPKRAALRHALDWVESKRDWIEAALARLPAAVPIVAGGEAPFEGRLRLIDWREGAPRAVRLEEDRFVLGGPADTIAARLLRWMRAEALIRLDRETRAMADSAGVSIARVAVGDPRTRWGSCSATGDIRYSWRLVLAPVEVREATVAHEVAHRLHMDHSPAFHAAVRRLLGRDPAPERAWLRANGAALYWLGRVG